jgi:hypothetical protein
MVKPIVTSLLAVVLSSQISVAQPTPAIRLLPDFGNAQAMLELYAMGVEDGEIDSLLRLEGTRAVIRQAQRFNSDATEERFVEGLRLSVAGEDVPEPDPFQFNRIRRSLDAIETVMDWIANNPDSLSSRVIALLAPYSPVAEPLEIRYFLVIGGNSDGWSRDGEFHIALQYFGDDVEGLLTLLSHEIYHVVQSHFMAPTTHAAGTPEGRVEQLLQSTVREGMASYVSNPLNTEGGGAYTEWYSRKYLRNLNHLELNFVLLETLVFRAKRDSSISLGDLYAIGFSGALESPAYFVGFEMARVIEQVSGRSTLLALLQQPTTEIFTHYASIADNLQGEVIPLGRGLLDTLHELRERSGR